MTNKTFSFRFASDDTPTPPSLATAWGYTNRLWYLSGKSTNGIDMANSGQPGFALYPRSFWSNRAGTPDSNWDSSTQRVTPSDTSKITSDGTFLRVQGLTHLMSAIDGGGGVGSHIGFGAPAGFHFQCSFKFTPAAGASPSGSIWAFPLEFADGSTPTLQFHEVDFWEALIDGLQYGLGFQGAAHGWDVSQVDNGPIGTTYANLITPDSTERVLDFLWVKPSMNGGNGFMKWYVDEVLKFTVNYTPGTTFGKSDDLSYLFRFFNGSGNPDIYIRHAICHGL